MVYNDLRVWPSWYDGGVLGVVCNADYACYVGSVLYNVVIITLACGGECACVCVFLYVVDCCSGTCVSLAFGACMCVCVSRVIFTISTLWVCVVMHPPFFLL